jgi:hypothetical protein
MFAKAICPESGREYLGLTRAEVYAYGDIVYSVVKANPRDPAKEFPQIVTMHFFIMLDRLLNDDDICKHEIDQIVFEAQKHQIGVPPALLTPGTTYEKFRGTWANDEYHTLRRFKYARWLIERAKKHDIDLAHEYGMFDCMMFEGTSMASFADPGPKPGPDASLTARLNYARAVRAAQGGEPLRIDWHQIAAEPQLAEMAAMLKKNRDAEKKKRSGSRAGNRAKELRAAGYESRGYAGWFKGGKVEKKGEQS